MYIEDFRDENSDIGYILSIEMKQIAYMERLTTKKPTLQ